MAKDNNNNNDSSTNHIPKLCQFWLSIHNSLPTIKLFGLDVSLTIVSSIFLVFVRYFAEFILISIFNWPIKTMDTKTAASSITSIVHSLNLVPVLYILLVKTVQPKYNPSAAMINETAGLWWNTSVNCMLQFCTGYMIYDSVLNVFWLNITMKENGIDSDDVWFLVHHVAAIVYMCSTQYVQAGHQSAMMCMFLGEFTNPLHNLFFIAEIAQSLECCNGHTSQVLFYWIRFLFGVFYVLFRTIIGPIAIIHATYNLLTTGMFHTKQLSSNPTIIIVWILLMWFVLIGSILWVDECWVFVLIPLPTAISSKLIAIFGGEIPEHDEL
jgi:TLC domain